MELTEQISRIKETLKKLGWKYEDLAAASGIPLSTILKVLSGQTAHPRIDTVNALEKALGLNEFPVVPEELKKIPVAFYEGLDGLTDESMQDILEYIQFVKEKQNKK